MGCHQKIDSIKIRHSKKEEIFNTSFLPNQIGDLSFTIFLFAIFIIDIYIGKYIVHNILNRLTNKIESIKLNINAFLYYISYS